MNYRLFSHGDVSYRFNGKNDSLVLESKIIYSKAKLFRSEQDKEKKNNFFAMFFDRLVFCRSKCFHLTSQKRTRLHVISFAGNYCLFAHSDVSYWFNGESDKIVLEYNVKQEIDKVPTSTIPNPTQPYPTLPLPYQKSRVLP